MSASTHHPHIVAIGGTTRSDSSTGYALQACANACEALGARVTLVPGASLAGLPLYTPEEAARSPAQLRFVDTVRHADGLILATPAYHAGMSGLLKNAIDLLEDLRADTRPYLHGRAVGCVVTAYGWQGAGTTLTSVRTIVHALRGWPTPLGVTMNTASPLFDPQGVCQDASVQAQIEAMAFQVVDFAKRMA